MSFEDEMRLHYLTVNFEESWNCINDGVRWWLTACAPMFYEKHWEIAYKSWKKVNTLTSPWSRVGVLLMMDIGCNTVLKHHFPETPKHPLQGVLPRVAQSPGYYGHAALKSLSEQGFREELEDCFLVCIGAIQRDTAYSPDALSAAIYKALRTLPDERFTMAMAELIESVLREDDVCVRGLHD